MSEPAPMPCSSRRVPRLTSKPYKFLSKELSKLVARSPAKEYEKEPQKGHVLELGVDLGMEQYKSRGKEPDTELSL